jgi:exoribonuclease-2
MYALFEDGGKFLAGRVMSEADTSVQVELDSGKRVKVKSANVLLRFAKPAPAELIARAQTLAQDIDLDLAWEFAPEAEFGFADLARDYFDASAGAEQQAAALLRLFEAPHYFRRVGKGQFKKAPEETVKAALLGIERKKQIAAQIEQWAGELVAGECPAPVREQLYRILFKPDKNGPEYKAVVEAPSARSARRSICSRRAGAIDSPYQFHWRRFLFEAVPQGHRLPGRWRCRRSRRRCRWRRCRPSRSTIRPPPRSTTRCRCRGLGSGTVTFGVHIAAPGLAIAPDSALDKVARDRLSTVYMPGWKLTMLPDEVVQAYTLDRRARLPGGQRVLHDRRSHARGAGQRDPARARAHRSQPAPRPARRRDHRTRCAAPSRPATRTPPSWPLPIRLALELKARREVVRGKPENFNRPDYNFKLDSDGSEPSGDERVLIGTRKRGAPLDLIVSEAMILANSRWGGWLAECGVPGIYRSQASWRRA